MKLRADRHRCRGAGCDKRAVFWRRGKGPRVRADKDHDLCPRCRRSLADRMRGSRT